HDANHSGAQLHCDGKTARLHPARSCRWSIPGNTQRFAQVCDAAKATLQVEDSPRIVAEFPGLEKFSGKEQWIGAVAFARYRRGYKRRDSQAPRSESAFSCRRRCEVR